MTQLIDYQKVGHFTLVVYSFIWSALCYSAEHQVSAETLGLIINELDPQSVKVGEYYAKKRGIPEKNLIFVELASDKESISQTEFAKINKQIDAIGLKNNLQAMAVAWVKPFRVDCMSITTAIALGFDKAYCASGCKPTKPIDYYNSFTKQPFVDYKIRPAMMLAGLNYENVKLLIDKGVSSDDTHPNGTAYLMNTTDKNRNVRASGYRRLYALLLTKFNISIIKNNILEKKQDVMFYFTGLVNVKKIQTNVFLPGAVADHLTSVGGALRAEPSKEQKQQNPNYQMSILRWLEAGATASYGAVVEPCNFPTKFPNPKILMYHYLKGDTVVEAYWKSVQMPGQGVFVGEPLARPFAK